jgi:hypothetical protein
MSRGNRCDISRSFFVRSGTDDLLVRHNLNTEKLEVERHATASAEDGSKGRPSFVDW